MDFFQVPTKDEFYPDESDVELKHILKRFRGLPVCHAKDEEEYNLYLPVLKQLNRGIIVLCSFGISGKNEPPNLILIETEKNDFNTLSKLLHILQPIGILLWENLETETSAWKKVIESNGSHCIRINNSSAITQPSQLCEIINQELWLLDNRKRHLIYGLNIGCGARPFAGWLNVDLNYNYPHISYMDAERPFPFPDKTFQYAYSEHLLEHLPFSSGIHMLREVYRVLNFGGTFVLSVPTLDFLINLYVAPKEKLHQDYVEWSINSFDAFTGAFYEKEQIPAMFVLNNFMHFWGHQMIYDINTLIKLLYKVGFRDVKCMEIEEFKLNNNSLEQHGYIIPTWANNLEAKTFVANK